MAAAIITDDFSLFKHFQTFPHIPIQSIKRMDFTTETPLPQEHAMILKWWLYVGLGSDCRMLRLWCGGGRGEVLVIVIMCDCGVGGVFLPVFWRSLKKIRTPHLGCGEKRHK